jgi:hypothetical protein
MSNKPRKGDRHVSRRVAFYAPHALVLALKDLARRNERSLTREILIALRERLIREGFWKEEKG